ncbi:MAG: bifunctional diguanylate cyclase/phosphodiesterase [Gammaproteobacteria bacterium]|nr:bifunctional diguanylate cyclase/phosphodiesterase [Gammaproteobacteria bacterium]
MSKFTSNRTRSLRKLYFSQTLFLGLLIFSVALYFFNETIISKQKVFDDRSSIQKKLYIVNQLENNLIDIFRNIELFLLDPLIDNHDVLTNQKIADSIHLSTELNQLFISESEKLTIKSSKLETQFIHFKAITSHLFESRMNVNKQFPGLALSANSMVMPQQSIANSLQILIDEIENGDLEPKNKDLYPWLLKAYALWMSEISQARIYYTNRFASFSTSILETQAESLNNLHDKFFKYLQKFEKIYANEDSFEGVDNIKDIKRDSEEWFRQFQQVRKLSESKQWRSDSYIMKTSVIPQFDRIFEVLHVIKEYLDQEDIYIQEQLSQTTNKIFILLASIIILFLFFIFTILFSLERMIFRPISSVSQALKSRAFDQDVPPIIIGKSREIRDLVEAFQEMDHKINQRQSELEHQSLHDHLTGLPNRLLLNQRLEYQILTSKRNQSCFILCLMDLDKFKDVNDSLGHANGDLLLIEVAKRLSNSIRQVDTIARLGGDEFAILLPEVNRIESEQVAEKLTESIHSNFVINDQVINIGGSIGIVSFPDDGRNAKTLLQYADIAMYFAKRNRLSYSYFDNISDIYNKNRLTLTNDLRHAIENNSLELYYQPQINISNNQIFGAEALLRWQHPEFGFIQPEKIVELAEYSGIIHQLTLWVMDKAIEQGKSWHLENYPLNISVNISVHDFTNINLCQQVNELLIKHQFSNKSLTLEITESGMMENLSRSVEVLKSLNKMGVNLSIDDFGTGFSSLSYLKQLPVNELKIDKSFVLDMDKNENDLTLVQSIVQLGHNLGLKVVAEGVEEQIHLDLISQFECDISQGYLHGKPQTKEEFQLYLERNM